MPKASIDTDTAGGDLIASASVTKFNDEFVVLDGDDVAGHGDGPHAGPTIPASINTKVKVEDKYVVVAGDTATCGHAATGSSDVDIV
jgi:uncharacterized Zn-binding protein involved in type VI secretion